MAITCPVGFDVESLREQVSATYAQVARDPEGEYHFHLGLDFACERLGYDRKELESLPERSTASFAGVGNPHLIGPMEPGETVLDVGSGAGMDLLLAARRVSPGGRAIGVDMTPAMRESALESAAEAGLSEVVEVRAGLSEELPLEDSSVDVVISNGVLNLATDKARAFGEVYRVLKPGGRLYLADVTVQVELAEKERSRVELWAA